MKVVKQALLKGKVQDVTKITLFEDGSILYEFEDDVPGLETWARFQDAEDTYDWYVEFGGVRSIIK